MLNKKDELMLNKKDELTLNKKDELMLPSLQYELELSFLPAKCKYTQSSFFQSLKFGSSNELPAGNVARAGEAAKKANRKRRKKELSILVYLRRQLWR